MVLTRQERYRSKTGDLAEKHDSWSDSVSETVYLCISWFKALASTHSFSSFLQTEFERSKSMRDRQNENIRSRYATVWAAAHRICTCMTREESVSFPPTRGMAGGNKLRTEDIIFYFKGHIIFLLPSLYLYKKKLRLKINLQK